MKNNIVFCLILVFNLKLSSQNNLIIKNFDNRIGLQNTNLSYGKLFVEEFRKIDGNHNYLKSSKFLKGDITYQNELFINIDFKYNLVDDNLIVKIPASSRFNIIVLEKKHVSKFKIENAIFINTKKFGFIQELESTNTISLYKKYRKISHKKINRNFTHYKFSQKENHIISFDNNFYEIDYQKSLIKVFPSLKNLIKKFFNENRSIRKRSPDDFYKMLVSKLNKELKTRA
ncbi:conserved hypothetical protein [Tenacibaculum sediminilitoris]|uniref:hypothetical protein n=1 Tax=Tenacibaculum sediminilitoris TaxID=1820334 RepID=UPI00389405E5